MRRPTADELAKLFEILGRQARDLRPACRWLIVGPEISAAILAEHARPPTAAELVELVRLLEREAPELVAIGFWLADASEHAQAVRVEHQLDQLLGADIGAWEHPTQILERPWPDLERLLEACVARRMRARGGRLHHLEQVEAKLERAVRIAASARRRRERMRRRK